MLEHGLDIMDNGQCLESGIDFSCFQRFSLFVNFFLVLMMKKSMTLIMKGTGHWFRLKQQEVFIINFLSLIAQFFCSFCLAPPNRITLPTLLSNSFFCAFISFIVVLI